jgi:hypothetical protein
MIVNVKYHLPFASLPPPKSSPMRPLQVNGKPQCGRHPENAVDTPLLLSGGYKAA